MDMVNRKNLEMSNIPARYKIGFTLFLLLIFSYVYFLQPPENANATSRMFIALALLENGTVKINKYHRATRDISFYRGNYYSDKAPGLSFTALPFIALGWMALRVDRGNNKWIYPSGMRLRWGEFKFLTRIGTYFTSGLMTAITALALYFVSLRIGASLSGAAFATLSFGVATPAWGWATAFFGHALAGSCLFLAFTAIFYLSQGTYGSRMGMLLGFIAGALLSWAVVVEYPAVFASAVIAVYGVVTCRQLERKSYIRALISAGVGGIIFIIPLLVYNYAAFGSPLSVSYKYVEGFEGMRVGYFGMTYPHLDVMYNIIFSKYRGILWISPVLIITPVALYLLWKNHEYRSVVIAVSAISVYYLLFNSAYIYWSAGWSTGPRYITPILPFLCLSYSILWTNVRMRYRLGLMFLFLLSFCISLVCVSVHMMSPDYFLNPLFDYLIPSFKEGSFTGIPQFIGFKGHISLIPLLLVWILGGFYLINLLINENKKVNA